MKALTAASEVLATQGVENLNLRAIAEAADMGIASIYHYFENKEDILLNLALIGYERLTQDIEHYEPDAPSPISGGARAFFGFAERQPALFALMFDEQLMSRHETLREAENAAFKAYEAVVEADGRIGPEHQAKAAFALWALGRGMASILASYPDGRPPADVAEKLFKGAAYLLSTRA
ncbi:MULTISPECIES: TetR/AcrR family transcriptional regulator [Phenylobacterium]|uniref:AcrR family transcriptional regulator n=1 Tax=Phenylobacterium koreense TaxID=266125 RepID=A0ABV2EFH1_9CAUL